MNKTLGVFLLLVAAAVAVQFVAEPLYMPLDPAGYDYPVWAIINWFMAAAILVALWVHAAAWKGAKNGDESCGSSCDCYMCGATVALALLFFHNWFLTMRFNPPSEIELICWAIIDTAFPVIIGYTGLQLMKKAT